MEPNNKGVPWKNRRDSQQPHLFLPPSPKSSIGYGFGGPYNGVKQPGAQTEVVEIVDKGTVHSTTGAQELDWLWLAKLCKLQAIDN